MSRPDYCPIGNQPCQSMCIDKCEAQRKLDDQLDEVLFEKMRELLTQTANLLKGAPAPLTLHSWHDLPEVAATLTADLARLTAELERSRREVEGLRGALLRICKIDTRSKRREFAAAAISAGEKGHVPE